MNKNMMPSDKLPPFSLEAEQSVLGACMLRKECVYEVLEWMRPQDFYKGSHRMIFDAMLRLVEQDNPITLFSLKDELEKAGCLEKIGGPVYLAQIIDITPTAANLRYYAEMVNKKALKRNLLNLCIETRDRCYEDKEESDVLLDEHDQRLLELTEGRIHRQFIPVHDIARDVYSDIERRAAGEIPIGLQTGFTDLDALLTGIQPSDLVIIAGRPAMGKTALALNLAMHFGVKLHLPGGMFNLEMSKEQVVLRLICSEGRIDSAHARMGSLSEVEWSRCTCATEIVQSAPIYIDDTPGLSIPELRVKARQLRREKQVEWLIIDYLQLMDAGIGKENRNQEITWISRQIKKIAKELNIPIFLLSQLSRECEKRTNKQPILSDLRDSGSIEQDADIVMFLYRPEVYDENATPGFAELLVRKHRNGTIGVAPLTFLAEYTRFETLAAPPQGAFAEQGGW